MGGGGYVALLCSPFLPPSTPSTPIPTPYSPPPIFPPPALHSVAAEEELQLFHQQSGWASMPPPTSSHSPPPASELSWTCFCIITHPDPPSPSITSSLRARPWASQRSRLHCRGGVGINGGVVQPGSQAARPVCMCACVKGVLEKCSSCSGNSGRRGGDAGLFWGACVCLCRSDTLMEDLLLSQRR